MVLYLELEKHVDLMVKVHDLVYLKEIKGEKVPSQDKIYSIYVQHTDIIVKGSREIRFGHNIDLCSGNGNLILYCRVLRGNPRDSELFIPAIDAVIENYSKAPMDYTADGGYACAGNRNYALGQGNINIVFNKIVGSLRNIANSNNMETRLKKWRSGAETVISNIKRGFNLRRCSWKGWEHFVAKVLWSVIAYNIKVMTARLLVKLA